jgi:uncharacterized protein YihD (DUF1040 family)
MTKKIVFQYFDGCPHYTETLKNLESLLNAKLFVDVELEIVEVPTPKLAKELNFQDSPTVLLDDIDIYTEEVPSSYNYSCRIFNIDGQQTGVLSTDYLRKKLVKLGITQPNKP